jgi:hypothetical protein
MANMRTSPFITVRILAYGRRAFYLVALFCLVPFFFVFLDFERLCEFIFQFIGLNCISDAIEKISVSCKDTRGRPIVANSVAPFVKVLSILLS